MMTLSPRLPYSPRRFESARSTIDLGNEAAIEMAGSRGEGAPGRHTPLRWLAGSALTGLTGLALIGSTLYLDLNQQAMFATAPEFSAPPKRDVAEASAVSLAKGDRLVRPVDIVADKQTFSQTVTMRIGDKEVLKARPYTLLSATLTTTPTNFADAVPPFDPLKLNHANPEKGDVPLDPAPPDDDTESGFTSRDIAKADIQQIKGELGLAEAQAQVAAWLKAQGSTDRIALSAPQMLLMRTSHAAVDPLGGLAYATTGSAELNAPFANIEVHMEPVNLSAIPRSPQQPNADQPRRKLAHLIHGETFEDLLRKNGASSDLIPSVMSAFGLKKGESPVTEGQKVILEFGDSELGDAALRLVRISVYADEQLKSAVAINDNGQFAPVVVKGAAATPPRKKTNDDSESEGEGGISLYQSLYETALKQSLPKSIIDELVRAFMNDVDFQRSAQAGDSMIAFMSDPDEIDPKPVLYYAALTVRDQVFHYYRFQTPDDKLVDYYDENGRSNRKFLLRKPIATGELTSGFGMRYHPILRFTRLHSGVDWGAPIGTPIVAAGSGIIIKAAYDSGYGRRVEIQHANGYVTTYNHMSAFERGIAPGVRISQGQIVGYLGQSGLATGPHLHYEVIINGNFVDPMAIKLARTREFDGPMLAQFRKERDRIDQLMTLAPNASASVAPPAGATARVN